MAIYQWKGRTRQGSLKKGEIEAVNEAAVMAQLRAQMRDGQTRLSFRIAHPQANGV